MSLYKEFSSLLPYLQSVRKINNYLSFDVHIPDTWKLPKKFVEEDKIVEQECSVPNQRLICFVTEITEDGVEKLSNNLKGIIKYNIEREEKDKLFEQKVNELKSVFEKQTLDSLQNLKFQIKTNNIKLEDSNEELGTKVKLVE
jgi:hypothetical protein